MFETGKTIENHLNSAFTANAKTKSIPVGRPEKIKVCAAYHYAGHVVCVWFLQKTKTEEVNQKTYGLRVMT